MSLDILNMSDDEILKLDPHSLGEQDSSDAPAAEAEDESEGQAGEEVAGDEGAKATDESSEDRAESKEEEGTDSEEEGADQGTEAPDSEDTGTEVTAEAGEQKAEEKTEKPEETKAEVVTNYEAEYKKLLAPFVANGKEMSVKSVDEAITLMQMGANYHKKMAALKPNLKFLKLLESGGLLSEEKISYLIDLANKDAGAINRLVKESGIDPMDLSTDKADEYKPTVRSVNEKEIELDEVLEEIQATPSYQRTLQVVGKEWDVTSRHVVADTPQLLKVINDHIQNGIYDMITAEVERERMFGRLRGVSDLEAYRQVGDAIQARGGFDHLVSGARNQGQQVQGSKPVVVQPKPKQVDESKLNDKRRAAAPTKPAATGSSSVKDFNPLAMSDEDFAKLAI